MPKYTIKPKTIQMFKNISAGMVEVFTSPFTKAVGSALKLPSEKQLIDKFDGTDKDVSTELQSLYSQMFKVAEEGGLEGFMGAIVSALAYMQLMQGVMAALGTPLVETRYAQGAKKAFRPNLLPVKETLVSKRRGLISEAKFKDILGKLGYKEEDIPVLEKLEQYIPTAQDIISMAVREVYSPEIAAKFGQFEGAEEVISVAAEDLKKAALPDETFRKLWAAHWKLPEVRQGYEMLHRGVITEDELDKLLVAADIMPFWREQLKAISFHPLTRVDVRRMHKLGLISNDELVKRYTDLGFSEENAGKMKDFTVEYNRNPAPEDITSFDVEAAANRSLTKTDILRGYKNGILKKSEAISMLSGIGYDSDTVSFLVSREEWLLEEEQTEDYLKLYRTGFLNDVISKEDLRARFGELNLPSDYQDQLIELWELEKSVKANMPTKAELLGFFKKGIITEDKARKELSKHGYSDEYINWYISGVGGGES